MSIKSALEQAIINLQKEGIVSAKLDAELILAKLLSKNREWLIAHDNDKLSDKELGDFNHLIGRRLKHEPVGYINQSIEFYGMDFFIDQRVLSPRVETELIVDEVIKKAPKNASLIDIGTGSGAIAVAIAKNRPDLKITATEVSPEALEVAKINAEKLLGRNHSIDFKLSDIWDKIDGSFDVVATNLPYVSEGYKPNMKPEVLNEPAVALFGGKTDGLDLYRRFYTGLNKHLNIMGLVYHESDPWQHEALKQLAMSAGLKPVLEDYLILGFQSS